MNGTQPRPLRYQGRLNRRGRKIVRRLTAERIRIYGEMLDTRYAESLGGFDGNEAAIAAFARETHRG
jgi:hypothetical protein